MSIIDREQLLDNLDGDLELLRDASELLREESQIMLYEIRAALAAGDIESVHAAAHSLKGMISNFMADSVCETTMQILMINDPRFLPNAAPKLDKLSKQIELMQTEIQQILESETSK